MAFPSRLPKDEKAAADSRPLSDADFARLSTEDKFRHIHLGMTELARALVELAAATTAANQEYSASCQMRRVAPRGRAHGE